MSQVDNRNSFAGKRARTDGGRREDDWTCPSCGNVNFSFRTTCNMHNCTQSRPSDHNSKSAPRLQTPPRFQSAGGYVGSASHYGGAPYGSSFYGGGSPLPSYDLPAGGSGYPYAYGGRISVGSPYGQLHMSAPSPYSSGMLGAGSIYGMPPPMDRYGMGMHMGHGPMGMPRPIGFPIDDFHKKPADAVRDNDWICPNCGNRNFAFRNVCNMRKCSTPRPGNQGPKSENFKSSKPAIQEGSWKCPKCNNINYPFRTKCNRQHCGAERPSESNEPRGLTSDEEEQ